jgi:CRP-like cAMP-binding protein
MSVLDGETRSATATATGRVRLLRLERGALLRTMDEQPAIAIAICQTLSRRVRELLDDRARLAASGRD